MKKFANIDTKEKVKRLKNNWYNSLAGYTNLKNREPFLNYSTILDYFGGDTEEGRRRYWQFVNSGLGDILDNPLDSGRGTGIVGSDSFVETIRDTYLPKVSKKDNREQPQLKEVKKKYNPEEFIRHYCRITEKDRNSVCSKGKNSIDRAILMELLYRYCKITQPEIGSLMGGIDYSSVSYSRKRLREKMVKDFELKRKFDRVDDEMSKLKILPNILLYPF